MEELEKFKKLLEIKRYAQNTIKSYTSVLVLSLSKLNKPIGNISSSDVQNYLYHKK
ncbi:MAG: hypothetical protein ACI81T_000705 [Bacteroidia bacterium]|jgi:hypothetical protein